MKNNIIILTFILIAIGLSSCINDESSIGGKETPELSIVGGEGAMPIMNFNLGDDCVITPEVIFKNGEEENLFYEWSIGTYNNEVKGDLEKVSNEKVLVHSFNQGGVYYAHLIVTDGKVGQAIDYQININRTFEEGYVLVSNDEEGNGNLAFIKIMTPEEIAAGIEQIRMENCLERMNEGMSVINLKNAVLCTVSWPKTLTRLLASVEDKCYFLDPNTFTVISELNYTELFPGFKATGFFPDAYSPYAYDATLGKYVHLDLTYMFTYEYKYYKGHPFEDIYMCDYSSFGRAAMKALFVNYSSSEICTFNAYSSTYFPSSLDLLKKEDIITAFLAEEQNPTTYKLPIYSLTQSKDNPSLVSLYQMEESGNRIINIGKRELTLSAETAIPPIGSRFVASPTYHRFFYSIKNKVYMFLTEGEFSLPKMNECAISYPENEIITCMDINIGTEELYVATYNRTSKRGSFYIYNTADVKTNSQGLVKPKEAHPNCADMISNILYKPRVNN